MRLHIQNVFLQKILQIIWALNNPHKFLRYVETLIDSNYENYDLRMLAESLIEKNLGNDWYKCSLEIFSRDLEIISKKVIDLIEEELVVSFT